MRGAGKSPEWAALLSRTLQYARVQDLTPRDVSSHRPVWVLYPGWEPWGIHRRVDGKGSSRGSGAQPAFIPVGRDPTASARLG